MIAPERFKPTLPRSGVLLGLGVRLALTGSILVVMYFFLVAQSPMQDLRETLSWAVPAGIVCWVFAVGFFAAGLVTWNSEEVNGPGVSSSRRESMRETNPQGTVLLRDFMSGAALAIQKRFPSVFHLGWSVSLLRSLDGKRFRDLGAAFFRQIGFRPISTTNCCREAVDIWLYSEDEIHAVGAVQCLPWGSDTIGVRQVRDFHRLMETEEIGHGVILTTGTFTQEALSFAVGKKLELISGEEFLAKISALPAATSEVLLLLAARGE